MLAVKYQAAPDTEQEPCGQKASPRHLTFPRAPRGAMAEVGDAPQTAVLYSLDHLPSESELLGMAERWRPYRSLAAASLFDSEFG